MRNFVFLLATAILVGCASAPQITPADLSRPSISNTKQLDFNGKTYVLSGQAVDQIVPIWEYFPIEADKSEWDELVSFMIYPINTSRNAPVYHAARTAKAFKQKFPHLKFDLTTDPESGDAYLDFFYPASTRKDGMFFEINFFKFFRDAGSANIISFHYAKNVPAPETLVGEDYQSVRDNMIKVRSESLTALRKFPSYRQ